MANDILSAGSAAGKGELFFESNYCLLRGQPPMKWMHRLFLRLTDGWCPALVDLPTGAGKTDVVVVWILALSWYGLDASARRPVPRRLVWVINRRVLVQQVFRLAKQLSEKLLGDGLCPLDPLESVRAGLVRLSGDQEDFFRIVELRGQLVDDREWSVAPAVPQLIVGTVDQIGSRLLFQGYGLGKWSLPLQASLLAVDAWVCVDEAHLVPAFVLTLRQARQLIEAQGRGPTTVLAAVFERLPFWLTELSATPALPAPGAESIFRLLPEDEEDTPLRDRLLAARTRRVNVSWLAADEKASEAISKAAVDLEGRAGTVAVFVRTPKDANAIATALSRKFGGERVLKITGRLRGYERDRLGREKVFRRFAPAGEDEASGGRETVFLVGTAAAEVGLDADAAAIVCDFASLPTLLQRLGRLDRRGAISRRSGDGACDPPTMTIFAKREETKWDIRRRFLGLARALRADADYLSASVLVGHYWKEATAKEGGEEQSKGIDKGEIVGGATRAVLLGKRPGFDVGLIVTRPPAMWLKRPIACVTGGPVAVPPLTSALIEHWCGTTEPRNSFVPVHPFLYGILADEEGTPLVSVAFRLEMDALVPLGPDEQEEAEDEEEGEIAEAQVEDIFGRFPPQRAEFHLIALNDARNWLASPAGRTAPVALFDGDKWSVASGGVNRPALRPGTTLVLPTLAHSQVAELLEGANSPKDEKASRDVLEGVSTKRPRYWRRVVQVAAGGYKLVSDDGACRFGPRGATEESSTPQDDVACGKVLPVAPAGSAWTVRLRCKLSIGTAVFRFEYLKPKRLVQEQFLEEHLNRAAGDAGRIASALSPDNEGLRRLLVEAAKVHDLGKENPKWQSAMGNRDLGRPVAKPCVEWPLSMKGFRHEWESLLRAGDPGPLAGPDERDWLELWRHLVVSHHGHLRPWLAERVLEQHALGKQRQSSLRLESAERFARLQGLLGPWRLAYLEGLLKAVDVAASQADGAEESDEQ